MFKALIEQWTANQEQKRAITAERWEQEKRWREEDRVTALRRQEEERVAAAQQQAEQAELTALNDQAEAEEKAARQETFKSLLAMHSVVMSSAATISYLSLTCHEDTWTYIARLAFGVWQPEWTTSVVQERAGAGGPVVSDPGFTKNPNLVPGRITKQPDGMQTVAVSGDNLVAILEALFHGAYAFTISSSLYNDDVKTCQPLYKRIKQYLGEIEQANDQQPGYALALDYRLAASEV